MKVLHLISGGDTGGAKTHVHSLLAGLTPRIQVKMVCFTEGPFVEEARALGIDTQVFPGRNFFANLKQLTQMVRAEGFDLIHSHGSRGNMMAAFLAKKTCCGSPQACLWCPPSTATIGWTIWAVPSPA